MKTLVRYLSFALIVGVNGALYSWADLSSSTFCKGELDEASVAAAAFVVAANVVMVVAMWRTTRAVGGEAS